jgi:hypothetical protein
MLVKITDVVLGGDRGVLVRVLEGCDEDVHAIFEAEEIGFAHRGDAFIVTAADVADPLAEAKQLGAAVWSVADEVEAALRSFIGVDVERVRVN